MVGPSRMVCVLLPLTDCVYAFAVSSGVCVHANVHMRDVSLFSPSFSPPPRPPSAATTGP